MAMTEMLQNLISPFSMNNTVLIVDDKARFGTKLVSYFKRRDVYARYVNDPVIAKHLIVAMNPAVIILEFCAFEKQASAFCSFIRNSGCEAEIILMCGCATPEAERKARRLSPAFYFVKPFNEDDLFAVVLRILEMQNRKYAGIAAARRCHRLPKQERLPCPT
jgi:DNA-binding NtrC family response regulator